MPRTDGKSQGKVGAGWPAPPNQGPPVMATLRSGLEVGQAPPKPPPATRLKVDLHLIPGPTKDLTPQEVYDTMEAEPLNELAIRLEVPLRSVLNQLPYKLSADMAKKLQEKYPGLFMLAALWTWNSQAPRVVEVKINGKKCKGLIDNGCSGVVIAENTYKALGLQADL